MKFTFGHFIDVAGYWLTVIFLFISSFVLLSTVLNLPGSIKLLTVQTGSMAPTISAGSVIVVAPAPSYQQGDIVTYRVANDPDKKQTITHRIFQNRTLESGTVLITKGDANEAPDNGSITKDQIIGKVQFSIPFLGYPISFIRTQLGLILFIIIPSTIIIYSELLTIKQELFRWIKMRQHVSRSMKSL